MIPLPPATRDLLTAAAGAFRGGRMADAVASYRALLEVEPRLPDSWFNRAIAERACGDPDAALRSLEHALDYGLTGPEEAHLRRAVILIEDRHDAIGAQAALEAALAIAPDYIAAWLNLGNLREDLGEREAARAAYARAHALAPTDALALARLIGASDEPGELLLRADRLLAGPLAPLAAADLGFASANALDAVGRFDEAFAAASAANAASRRVNAAANARYDPAAFEALAESLAALTPQHADPIDDGPVPIFVCGSFRSGSTLAEQMLVRHGGVHGAGELPALVAIAAEQMHADRTGLAAMTPDHARELRRRYRERVAPLIPAERRFVDKRPDNILHIPLIRRLFPEAPIVITTRDPRDLAVSLWFLHAGPGMPYASDLADIAHHTQVITRLTDRWRRMFPDAIHLLDYDRLVVQPEREIAALLSFTKLERAAGVQSEPALVRTASHRQVRKPLYVSSSGRWRNYARQLAAAGLVEASAS